MQSKATLSSAPFTAKTFRGKSGGSEHYIAVTAPSDLNLARQIEHIQARYAEARASLRLAPDSAVFRRLFLSDPINQAALVRECALFREPEGGPVAVSIVGQPPLPDTKVAMLAYHVTGGPLIKRQLSPKHMIVQRNGLRHLWSTRLCASTHGAPPSAEGQTWEVFGDLIGTLAGQGGNLRDHCVRTWLYIKDVDVFYRGMVESRGKLFRQHGLTEETHYVASTGIEGACAHQYDVVMMDAYSVLDIVPRQTTYLSDLDKLCATKDYNVQFERGTKVAYKDRAHHFISGTASIDANGRVVNPGDVGKQLARALENVEGLLNSGGARLEHMTHLIVYLRDASDLDRVCGQLSEQLGELPVIYTRAPVCRPDWLVEIEGIAINSNDAPDLPDF